MFSFLLVDLESIIHLFNDKYDKTWNFHRIYIICIYIYENYQRKHKQHAIVYYKRR